LFPVVKLFPPLIWQLGRRLPDPLNHSYLLGKVNGRWYLNIPHYISGTNRGFAETRFSVKATGAKKSPRCRNQGRREKYPTPRAIVARKRTARGAFFIERISQLF